MGLTDRVFFFFFFVDKYFCVRGFVSQHANGKEMKFITVNQKKFIGKFSGNEVRASGNVLKTGPYNR